MTKNGCVVAWTTLLVIPFPAPGQWPLFDPPVSNKTLLGKAGHVLAYALMTVLTAWLRLGFRTRLLFLFFLMAHAVTTEWVQLHLSGRTGTVDDVVLNQLGILLGLVVSWKWWRQAE